MMLGGHRVGVVLSCALLTAASAMAQEPTVAPQTDPSGDGSRRWNGLFQVREQFPLTMGYLVLEPTSGFTLPDGTWELELAVTESNTFTASQLIERALDTRSRRGPFDRETFDELAAVDPSGQTHYLDAQVGRFALRARRGLSRGIEIDLLVPVFQVHGGSTDRLVEAFHDLTQLDQEGRKGVYRDRLGLFVSGQGIDVDLQGPSDTELGDIVLGVKKIVLGDGRARSLLVALDLKLPTGDERHLISSGAADVGLSLVGSRCWSSRCLHAMAGVVFAGESETETLPTDSQSSFSGALGFEQAWRKGWGLTVQGQYWESFLDDLGFDHFAEDTIQMGVTASKATRSLGELFLGVSENGFSFKNSSDVTYHIGWRRRLE